MTVQSSYFEQAIAAVRAGRKTEARALLQTILAADPSHEDAWLWMSAVVDSDAQRAECLRRVLRINPHNAAARKGLWPGSKPNVRRKLLRRRCHQHRDSLR